MKRGVQGFLLGGLAVLLAGAVGLMWELTTPDGIQYLQVDLIVTGIVAVLAGAFCGVAGWALSS